MIASKLSGCEQYYTDEFITQASEEQVVGRQSLVVGKIP
jgi:hypothetical protein